MKYKSKSDYLDGIAILERRLEEFKNVVHNCTPVNFERSLRFGSIPGMMEVLAELNDPKKLSKILAADKV